MVALAKAVTAVHHVPQLHAPWFAASEGVTLHRYLDDQFVQNFVQDAMSARLTATRDQPWYNSDRFGRNDLPTLRLPLHQTFYIACCEVSCDTLGLPAFDPKRIRSAGFVIRRRTTSGAIQRWMLHEGQPIGWQSGGITTHEPSDYQRFVNSKLLQPQYPEPAYSGEETHPLRPLLARSKQASGKSRSHTLLWGYVPLGGSYRVHVNSSQPSRDTTEAIRQELTWPYGERSARDWSQYDNRPVYRGVASQAFFDMLELLLLRYRVFDVTDEDNSELRAQLGEIYFYPSLLLFDELHPFNPFDEPPADTRGDSLLSWIENHRDAILQWLSDISIGRKTLSSSRVPLHIATNDDGTPVSASRGDDLYITEQQAAKLRDTLLLRGGRAMTAIEDGMSLPRFGQADDDRFFIVPFVRYEDDCGCERIHWGAQTSIDFRVVSPLDPEAQRPRTIILPGLDDIKRGAAKGVTVVVPKSLATLLRKIKPTMDMEEGGPGNPAGLCWTFSLSIPAITICAFMVLMVVLNLLNLFLGWLPWVFLALPKLCGKLLSENKS